MREMGWSWQEMQATPVYVRMYCWEISQIRRSAEAARANKK
jgi:hypothetical protein